MATRWPLSFAILILTGALATDALAFKCSRVGAGFGPSLVWNLRVIPWYAEEGLFDIYGDRISAEEDVRASFMAWEEVACSDITLPLAAIIPGLTAGYDDAGDNKNVVVAVRAWPYDRGALAITTSAYDTRTGQVVDADIEINDEFFDFAPVGDDCIANDGTMDLRNTLTHEAGHVVGLDHPPSTPRYEEVTMFASAPPCETKKRSLDQDDIEGLCSIYPVGNPTQQCYPPDGPNFTQIEHDDGFGCSTTRGSAAIYLCLPALLFAWSRSRSRSRIFW